MEPLPNQPKQQRPTDPHLPTVRASAPSNRAEQHRTAGPVPTQQTELGG